MTRLHPHAESALDRVRDKHLAYKLAKDRMMSELMEELDKKLESYIAERDAAVVMADQAGVPRTHIGKALGTSNYRTVQEILEATKTVTDFGKISEESNWSVVQTPDGWQLTITNLGPASVTGTALVTTEGGELVFVSGDAFVVPQVYRNGISQEVARAISLS